MLEQCVKFNLGRSGHNWLNWKHVAQSHMDRPRLALLDNLGVTFSAIFFSTLSMQLSHLSVGDSPFGASSFITFAPNNTQSIEKIIDVRKIGQFKSFRNPI